MGVYTNQVISVREYQLMFYAATEAAAFVLGGERISMYSISKEFKAT